MGLFPVNIYCCIPSVAPAPAWRTVADISLTGQEDDDHDEGGAGAVLAPVAAQEEREDGADEEEARARKPRDLNRLEVVS